MPATSTVYAALPGLSVPMGQALEKLSSMWSAVDEHGRKTQSEYRASRMNLVVHIGFEADVDEATALFQSVISFSHRYPCRLIVLCPQPDSWDSEDKMSCKIFSECVFGGGASGMSCCEALILGYTLHDRKFLENQVSVFLETDLPTYYWPTRFGSAELLSDYTFFFKSSKRILFDSARECFSMDQVNFPQPEKVHDLAFSRLLSIRQSIGQFLSGYETERIVAGLKSVTLECCPAFQAEGKALLRWVKTAIQGCFPEESEGADQVDFEQKVVEDETATPVMRFVYEDDRFLTFDIDLDANAARVEADLGNGKQVMATGVRLLDAETTLAEALFFS